METLSPIQALRTGLVLVLDMCRQQGLSSVALPVIGPGIALKFPLHEAIRIVTEEIIKFGWSGSTGLISTIRIVIKPVYPDSDDVRYQLFFPICVKHSNTFFYYGISVH